MKSLLTILVLTGVIALGAPRGLTTEQAVQRSERLEGVEYNLWFSLDSKGDTFQGTVKIDFQLSDSRLPLILDFNSGELSRLVANGTALGTGSDIYDGEHIHLPAKTLRKGNNQVEIDFSHPYSNSGAGLIRSFDRVDGQVYLYSFFEPYNANAVFPCFDQPDLKARYTLAVEVPDSWKMISNTRESSVEETKEGKSLWKFPQTLPFSTYLFAIHGGQYAVWEDFSSRIPMRLFARKSLSQWVPAQQVFEATKAGFAFFEKYFGIPYPYHKYDQVFVPDFTVGGMENVGAVILTDSVVSQSQLTGPALTNLYSLIFHELAHMWFGNLVTMKWWNDIWLNESFATYMSFLALDAYPERPTSAWKLLFDLKRLTYVADLSSTSHPIAMPVLNANQAFNNADLISYIKGASSLKQLSHGLSEPIFRKGIKNYLEEYSFKNATEAQFMDTLERTSERPLQRWSNDWLKTSHPNTIRTQFECRDGKIERLKLIQSGAREAAPLRQHFTQVGLYHLEKNALVLKGVKSVSYSGEETIVEEFVGEPCPVIVHPNQGDLDYVLPKYDRKSLEVLERSLGTLSDELTRSQLWHTYWRATLEEQVPMRRFADIAFEGLTREGQESIRNELWGRLQETLRYLPENPKRKLVTRLENYLWSEFLKEQSVEQRRGHLARFFSVSSSPEGQLKLLGLLEGTLAVEGFQISQQERWTIIQTLNSLLHEKAEPLRVQESERDKSVPGITSNLHALVIRPDIAVKREWLTKLFDTNSKLSVGEQRVVMASLFPQGQEALAEQLADEFYAKLETQLDQRNEFFFTHLGRNAPRSCTEANVERIRKFNETHPSAARILVKHLELIREEEERCVRLRKSALKFD